MAAGTWANNAELIRDAVVPLGYPSESMTPAR